MQLAEALLALSCFVCASQGKLHTVYPCPYPCPYPLPLYPAHKHLSLASALAPMSLLLCRRLVRLPFTRALRYSMDEFAASCTSEQSTVCIEEIMARCNSLGNRCLQHVQTTMPSKVASSPSAYAEVKCRVLDARVLRMCGTSWKWCRAMPRNDWRYTS